MKIAHLLAPLFALARGTTVGDCLTLSDQTVGTDSGDYVNNFVDLVYSDSAGKTLASFDDDMRLGRIVVCIDGDRELVGLQMTLVDEFGEDELPLSSLGYTRESIEKNSKQDPDCQRVTLDGEIDSLKVSSNQGRVNAISFLKGENTIRYGSMTNESIDETFSGDRLLFGLYGN